MRKTADQLFHLAARALFGTNPVAAEFAREGIEVADDPLMKVEKLALR
jgi:hypothetical protein